MTTSVNDRIIISVLSGALLGVMGPFFVRALNPWAQSVSVSFADSVTQSGGAAHDIVSESTRVAIVASPLLIGGAGIIGANLVCARLQQKQRSKA